MGHKHVCLNCGETIAEGDFDCEFDLDHDFALCEKCAEKENATNAREPYVECHPCEAQDRRDPNLS